MDSTPPSDVRRATPAMRLATAARLVETRGVDATDAGLRFLSRAADHGIDLELLWAVTRDGQKVRQAALVVPQPGRTAMLFLSGVGRARECGDRRRQHEDRVALLRGVLAEVPAVLADRVHLVQALPAPEEWWATEAFAGAGMTRLGDLAYLRRPLALPVAGLLIGDWPEGVTVSPLRGLDDHLDGPALRRALERSYIDTLDCPGLCDLRDTRDVIESHRATGEFDPSLWWVVRAEGEPEGCVLLSPSREQDTVELVYMGLGPALRGRGLGRRLLAYAIGHAQRCRLGTVTCAVDCRNEPARALYARLGFSEFARRIAYVHPVRQAPTDG